MFKEKDHAESNFKRNTQYQSFNGVVCCTCSYCVKNTQNPTITFKNFRPIPNNAPEYFPKATPPLLTSSYTEYTPILIPSGEFTYELDFDAYSLYNQLQPYHEWFQFGSESLESPDSKQRNKYASNLVYWPFKKCTGVPTGVAGFYQTQELNPFDPQPVVPFGSWNLEPSFQPNPTPWDWDFSNPLPNFAPYGAESVLTYWISPGDWLTAYEYVWEQGNTTRGPSFYYGSNLRWSSPYGQQGFTYTNYWAYRYENGEFIKNDLNSRFAYTHFNPSIWDNYLNQRPTLQFVFDQCGRFESTSGNHIWQNIYDFEYWAITQSFLPGIRTCTESEIISKLGVNSVIEKPIPVYKGINIGNYQGLLDYIDNHDFFYVAGGGINKNNSCENGVVKFLNPFPLVDYSSYQFQNVFNGYSEDTSFRSTQFNPNEKTGIPPNLAYVYQDANQDDVVKGGFVLNLIDIDLLTQKINNIWFTMISEADYYFTLFDCPNPEFYTESDYPGSCFRLIPNAPWYSPPDCCFITLTWNQKIQGEYYSQIIGKYTYYPVKHFVLNEYENGIISDTYINAFFGATVGGSQINGNLPLYPPPNSQFEWPYPDGWPYPIKNWWQTLSFGYKDSKEIFVSTDSSGSTKMSIKSANFIGPTYLSTVFKNPTPDKISSGYLSSNYNAYLTSGFQCDIEITYQSEPICKRIDIPDKLKYVKTMNVNIENYREYYPGNFSLYDGLNYIVNENPLDMGLFVSLTSLLENSYYNYNFYQLFNTFVFAPPETNADITFTIDRNGFKSNYQQTSLVAKYFTSDVYPSNWGKKGSYNSRIYDSTYSGDYKDSILVNGSSEIWQTGSEITISGNIIKSLWNYRNSTLYCIFVKEIKDEKQKAGQTLIRIASSLQNANNEINLPIDYSTTPSSGDMRLKVKYFTNINDVSKINVPKYSNFNPNDYNYSNTNLENYGFDYTYQLFNTSLLNGQMNLTLSKSSTQDDFPMIFKFPAQLGSQSIKADLTNYKIELISISPIKYKYKDVLFSSPFTCVQYYFSYYTPYAADGESYPYYQKLIQSVFNSTFGFLADIVFEESIDSHEVHVLPGEFNGISSMEGFIQASSSYQTKIETSYRNPEKCTHIGKVIDRKNCNCPKKWIRQCDIHETTDWKKCMACPNYQPED